MDTYKSLEISWMTPEHFYGASDVHDEDVERIVRSYFPEALRAGSGGGMNARDIDWDVDNFLDQEKLDEMGMQLAKISPGRVFHVSQSVYPEDLDLDRPDLEHLYGAKGEYVA